MNTFTRTAGIVIPVLAVLAGCNTMEPPEAELVQAKTQVQSADSAQADQYAALSMKRAKEKIEQAEKAMEIAAPFFSPVAMGIMVTIFSVFFGFLCGLVSGVILKKDKPYQ